MSAQDELAEALDTALGERSNWESYGGCLGLTEGATGRMADALIAEGWRKAPSHSDLMKIIWNAHQAHYEYERAVEDYGMDSHVFFEAQASTDAILALMEVDQ